VWPNQFSFNFLTIIIIIFNTHALKGLKVMREQQEDRLHTGYTEGHTMYGK